MDCPKCAHENRETAKFCEECAAPLVVRPCSSCGAELRPTARFCDECSQPATACFAAFQQRDPSDYTPKHLADKILDFRDSVEGERKMVTALFADIKGSMELMEDLDPEEARRVIDPALQLMMDGVHRYEGYVAQSAGDGIFAMFGAPIAHEDHAQRALYAALLMQDSMARYSEKLRAEGGAPVQMRVGVNTGEVVVRAIRKDDLHTDYDSIGHSTGLAARMEAIAAQGSVLVSEHTHKFTEGYFQFNDLGATKIKGVSDPVHVYEVEGVGPLRTRLEVSASRGLVRFVGRKRELEQMNEALDLAKEGHGQIVAIMGEAGVGKSRLVYEFKVVQESKCLVLEAFSVSHGKAHAYLPLVDLLKSYFLINLQDDERRRREKITGKVLTLDRGLEDLLPYLFSLLGVSEPSSFLTQMDPQMRRQRTMDAVKGLLVRESLNQPLVLIFEDLHWIDSETQEFLDLVAESLATAKIMLLANFRPEYENGWTRKTYYTRLRLDPLGKKEAEELLDVLLGNGARSKVAPLKKLILERTEGNPFFMEEVVQTLAEQNVLVGTRGDYRLEKTT
ncbi:MAG: adenylate/guanylate cyclase domain-containing protein, partial [Candidatus Binatia bacterium]